MWLGAQLSSRAPGGIVRRALAFVLLASALKLLGVSTVVTGLVLLGALLVAPPLWMVVRRRHGLPMTTVRGERAPGRVSQDEHDPVGS